MGPNPSWSMAARRPWRFAVGHCPIPLRELMPAASPAQCRGLLWSIVWYLDLPTETNLTNAPSRLSLGVWWLGAARLDVQGKGAGPKGPTPDPPFPGRVGRSDEQNSLSSVNPNVVAIVGNQRTDSRTSGQPPASADGLAARSATPGGAIDLVNLPLENGGFSPGRTA